MNEQVQLIADFIDEKLQGNIYSLVSYDIAQLKGDRKYGEGKGRYFDCDDTNLSRAIFTVVFDGVWKDLNSRTLEQGKYRGDTINSFNTLVSGKLLLRIRKYLINNIFRRQTPVHDLKCLHLQSVS